MSYRQPCVPVPVAYDQQGLQLLNVSNGNFLSQGEQVVALVHREDTLLDAVEITASLPADAAGVSGQGVVNHPYFSGEGRRTLRQLHLSGDLARLAQPKFFAAWLRPLFRKNWVVYSKPPFGGPEYVLHYLGRYTHRVAISTIDWSRWPTAKSPFAGGTRRTTISRN